jgi:hypothetical protein
MPLIVRQNLTFARSGPELPADSAELAALAGHVRAGRCALFVGAGLSAPAGLPTWGAIMEQLVAEATPWGVDPALFDNPISFAEPVRQALEEPVFAAIRTTLGPERFDTLCRRIQRARGTALDLNVLYKALEVVCQDSIDRRELRKLADRQRYSELAGFCRDRMGAERFAATVQRSLTPRGDELPATHRDIVRTPFACVVTTNFDTLLESAYARYGDAGVPRAPTGAELAHQGTLLLDGGFFVLKAHGDACRPETMVFTADDYRRVIHSNPAFQAIVGGILLTHTVLFAGYSLGDPNFRLLLDNHLTIFNGNVPPRYAILPGVDGAEREILWRTAKLQVLAYPEGQHAEVGRCLSVLADLATGRRGGRARRRPPVRPALPALDALTTLSIDGDGDRLAMTLVRTRADAEPRCVFVGACPLLDTRPLGNALRRADSAQGAGRHPGRDIKILGSVLARTLPRELRRGLARVPERESIEIACSTAATRLPWEWLVIAGRPLALRNPAVRRSADVTAQARGRRSVKPRPRLLVIGDAGGGNSRRDMPLHFAELEAATIERLFCRGLRGAEVTRLSLERATHRRVLQEIESGDYDVIHFGGHAWFDEREAYFFLWDRIMLGSELAPLLSRRPPALMMLDTHFTAFVLAEADTTAYEIAGTPDATRGTPPPGAPRGFAEAAMRCGVSCFAGAFGNVGDRSGAELSVAFYAELLAGHTAAEALRRARHRTARLTRDAGMFYTVFGYPDFRLVAGVPALATATAVTAFLATTRGEWPEPPPSR